MRPTHPALPPALLALLLIAVGTALAQEPPSLMVNGGFEAGDGAVPAGWSLSLYPEGGDVGACLTRSREQARSGDWSLKVDTGPVLGQDLTLVFNGPVAPEVAGMRGQHLELSGWVYTQPGTALRPMGMRLRTFGPNEAGETVFLRDILSVQILGEPGRWTEFRGEGTVPEATIASVDLHCGLRPDVVPTVQFLDDIVLRVPPVPPLELRLPRSTIWRDEGVLAVETRLGEEAGEGARLRFQLLDAEGRRVAQWRRKAATTVFGLDLPTKVLAEGRYTVRAEVEGTAVASAEAPLELAASAWEGAPQATGAEGRVGGGGVAAGGPSYDPEAALGTSAPTTLEDKPEGQPETLSPDLDTREWEERGYAVFTRHYLEPVSRAARPRPGEAGTVRLFACPGEYEPATVAVWALQPLSGVEVTVSDLRGEEGAIPAACVDVRVVRTIDQLPPFLERRVPVGIPEGQTQTFWLDLHVPRDAAPGFYRGAVSVRAAGRPPTTLGLLLRVLPLELPAPTKGYGFWWKMDGRWNGYYSQEHEAALEQIRKQFVMLREHGCNMVSCYGMPKMSRADDGTLTMDFTQDHWGHDRFSIADFFRLGRETGFLSPRQPIQYPGAESLHTDWVAQEFHLDPASPQFAAYYAEACRRVNAWAKEQGYTLAYACVDEIGNGADRQREALRYYRIATEAGVLTSVTGNSMHGGVHLMGQARFDDIIAMRLYNFITPEMIEDTQASGDRLWLYNLASGGWSALRDRFVFGLLTERCGAEGCAQWAFQWPSGNTDPYEAAAAGADTGYHYALPAPDGPLPTVALRGVREGIDDARYLALLRAKSPGSAAGDLGDVPQVSVRIGDYLEGHDATSADVRRWRVAEAAM